MQRRHPALFGAALLLAGCAPFNRVDSDVSTYGSWPAGRQPGSYAFERLPSQQAKPTEQKEQQLLENSARGALQRAGFTEAGSAADAQYLVQLGARVFNENPWVFNDPLFWRSGWRYGGYYGWGRPWGHPGWFYGRGFGPGWTAFGPYDYPPTYSREVALVIRDRRSNEVLYEARADNTGPTAAVDPLLPAMFQAAMQDFPAVSPEPKRVRVDLGGAKS